METRLKYTVIDSRKQYDHYCRLLEKLADHPAAAESEPIQQEIELLTVLIEKWDNEHNSFNDSDPVQLLKTLMADHQLKARDLVDIMGVSKGMVSSILNYRKGLSKESIRKLAGYFKLSQEAFNRPYKLISNTTGRTGKTLRNAKTGANRLASA